METKEMEEFFKKVFSKHDEIISVYLYGSVLFSDFFEDIDIGVLLDEDFDVGVLYEAKLIGELEKAYKEEFKIQYPIDLQILNHQTLRFLFTIFKTSLIIYSKNDLKRSEFETRIIGEYFDIKPHYDFYDKMREIRYANR